MEERDDELIPTRATLIQRLQNWQDQTSWQEFFDTYWHLLYGVALKRGLTQSEAQDVVQETMISVSRKMPAFKYDPAIGSFKAWLLNLTRWRISDQLRRRQQQASQQELAQEPITEDEEKMASEHLISPDLEKLWDEEWEKNLLASATTKARRQMDPKQYQIFDFCVNKEWPPERIAQVFGLSLNQIYLAKHRMTELIKAEVERLKKEII
jgi:RNA polymerase sigma-70 factor (ECF subfamily)